MLKQRVLDELWRGCDLRKPVSGHRPFFLEAVGTIVRTLQGVILSNCSVRLNPCHAIHSSPATLLRGSPSEQEATEIIKDADARRIGIVDITIPDRRKPATVFSGVDGSFTNRQLCIVPVFEEEVDACDGSRLEEFIYTLRIGAWIDDTKYTREHQAGLRMSLDAS